MSFPSVTRRNTLLGFGVITAATAGIVLWRESAFLRSRTDSSVSMRRVARLEPKGEAATWGRSEIDALAWSPDGRHLAMSFDWGHAVALVDTSTWKIVGRIDQKKGRNLRDIAFLSETEIIALGFDGESRTALSIYDIQTGRIFREIFCNDSCAPTFKARFAQKLTITSNKKYAVVAVEYPTSRLLLFNLLTGQFVSELSGTSYSLLAAVAAGPGNFLATSVAYPPDSKIRKKINLVDAEANQVYRVLDGHIPHVSSLCWSPNGDMLVSGASGLRAEQADLSGKPLWIRDRDPARVWDTKTGELLVSFGGEIEPINSLTWHPAGKVFAAAGSRSDGRVGSALRLWSVPDRKMIFEFFVPHQWYFLRFFTGGFIPALSFQPVIGHLAIGLYDGLDIYEVNGLT